MIDSPDKKREGIECPQELDYLEDKPTEETWKQRLYGYSLMVWDGLGYFGTDHTKLGRLEGEKVTFWTPFKSYKVMILSTIGFIVATYVIVTEFNKLGTRKSQTISLI